MMDDNKDDVNDDKVQFVRTTDIVTSVPIEIQRQTDESYKITDAVITAGMPVPVDSSVMSTLQSLLASPINQVSGASEPTPVQIIAAAPPSDVLSSAPTLWRGNVWQIVHSPFNPEIATIVAINPSDIQTAKQATVTSSPADSSTGQVDSIYSTNGTIAVPVHQPRPLPPDCPNWATRLKDCEKIGDFYRGYVETEVELDLLLTFHKQQTESFWGTRQSPNLAKKPSTRLMWKSQYVPFDGIPFINNGSRAVVMECQYGPRRKGVPQKNQIEPMPRDYKQTCPARIYVKRVKKFPEFAVEYRDVDRKVLRVAMDRAFGELRNTDHEILGQERHYIQLPTENAHEFHHGSESFDEEMPAIKCLDPRVAVKIREIVASGETRVYAIRKALRRYMTKMLMSKGSAPERHDLTCFPTVNDLKNHIHQAIRDIENGSLPLTASQVNVEVISGLPEQSKIFSNVEEMLQSPAPEETNVSDGGPIPETVTVTLTPNPGQDGRHMISRIETHLSDGSTQISSSLTPETAQLLSKLHPGMFPEGSFKDMFPTENQKYEENETDTTNRLPTMVSQATLSSTSIPTRLSPDLIPQNSFIPSSISQINNLTHTTGHLVSSSSNTACDNLLSLRGGGQLAIPTVQPASSSSDSLHECYTLKYESQPTDHLTTRTMDYTLPADQLILTNTQGMDEDISDLPSQMIVTSGSESLLSMISAKQLELGETGQDEEITLQIVQPDQEFSEERSMIVTVTQDENGIVHLTQPPNVDTPNILQIDTS